MRAGFVDLLAHWPLVSACTPAERRAIARAADYIHVPAGVVVSTRNMRLDPVVIVAHGELCVIGREGVTIVRDGAVLGAAEVLANRARAGQVVTTTDADLVLIEPRRLLPLLERCPNLAVALLRTFAQESLAASA